jgi:hypothetical protein
MAHPALALLAPFASQRSLHYVDKREKSKKAVQKEASFLQKTGRDSNAR